MESVVYDPIIDTDTTNKTSPPMTLVSENEDESNGPVEPRGSVAFGSVNRSSRFLDWKRESIACLLAVATVLAIFGTIFPYDRKPIPAWPDTISLNTLLSIYTAILESCLIFVVASGISQLQWIWLATDRPLLDLVKYKDASSGAWGSAKWLWSFRLRQPLTAFGATLAILVLGIGPFSQQLLSYVDCSITLNDSIAILPRTNYFQGHGVVWPRQGESVEAGLQSAINAGFYGAPYTVKADCSSGNCTFPDTYVTVGYCSACEDTSSRLSINQSCYDMDFSADRQIPRQCSTNTTLATITTQLSDTIPYAINTLANFSVTWDSLSSSEPALAAMQVAIYEDLTLLGQYEFRSIQTIIGKTVYSLREINPTSSDPIADCHGKPSDDSWLCQGYGAAQCTLQPCVREYRASVEAGTLQEMMVDSTDVFFPWGVGNTANYTLGTLGLIDTRCLTSQESLQLVDQGYLFNSSTRWLPYNVTDNFNASIATAPFSRCVYAIDGTFANSLYQWYLGDSFNGTITASQDNVAANLEAVHGPQALQTMYNLGNYSFSRIDEMFHNVSDSMTAYIRSVGFDGASDPATGQVTHYSTCLRVQWPWISFSSALVLLTILFFVATISRTWNQTIWSDSPLNLIFHGPGSVSWAGSGMLEHERLQKLNTSKGMNEVAQALRVKLDRNAEIAQLSLAKGE